MPEAMIRLEPSPTVPATARTLVDRFGAADTVAGSYDVRLVVSELVSGALDEDPVQLIVRRSPDTLRVEVTPAGAFGSEVPEHDPDLPLDIVRSLSDRWGVDRSGPDRTVWCEFTVRHAAQPA